MEIAIPACWGGNFASLGTKEEGSFANVIIHSGGKEVSLLSTKLVEFSLEEKSIRDWHSSIKICIIRSLTWSYSGLQSDGDLYPGSFAPLFFHRREISDEIPPNGGTRYRGGGRLPDGEKHRETRYSKILTREIYICI